MSTPVCVVGSGGREHALARWLARSVDVVVAPGNEGMPGRSPEGHAVSVTTAAPESVGASLYVVGPEAPLVDGLADRLRSAGHLVVGPGADGAQLEGSKAFMKEVLVEAGVPTARHGVFDTAADAVAFLRSLPGPPWVVKTDGLAAGKGVLVAGSLAEAEADVAAKLAGSFGEAGRRVVVEEGLVGTECSLQVLCDGTRVMPLVVAQDHKRVGDGDTGPNTGGMGAFAPVPSVGPELVGRIMGEAVEPLVGALRRRGIDYRGVLYAGLMLTAAGPKVLEYNIRFGDPEAQVVLPLLADDPVRVLTAVAAGDLAGAGVGPATLSGLGPEAGSAGAAVTGAAGDGAAGAAVAGAAVSVVLAAEGYPEAPRPGDRIEGLGPDGQLVEPVEGVTVLHAGTARPDAEGPFVTAGGRVLDVTAVAPTLEEARRRAYEAAGRISWPGVHYRRDIGGTP